MALSNLARRLLTNALMSGPEAKEFADAIDTSTAADIANTALTAEIVNLDGVLMSTAAEIDAVTDVSARIVAVGASATTFAVTVAAHGGRIINVNTTVPIAITLPPATGTGQIYTIDISVVATATGHTIKVANATDIMRGFASMPNQAADAIPGFKTTATDDTITLNGTTLGGQPGDTIEIIDFETGKFHVHAFLQVTGTGLTPFSATVSS